jgi:hypothetical protein
MAESKARNINKSFNPSGTVNSNAITPPPTAAAPNPQFVLASVPATGALDSADVTTIVQLDAIVQSNTQGNKNLIINGKFSIFQRGTGATTVNGNDVFAADRFKGWANGGGTYTVEQSTDVPNNEFEYSAKLTNTGVDSSVAAGDNYRWATDIEGYNVSHLGYGHSDAKAVTLSFWVKSSLAGTYCGALYSTTASRHYIYEYTISSANTWEKKTITVSSGDTTGSWNKTNGNGLRVYWGFGSGSNYQGTAGAWTAGEKWETSNQAAWIGSASATFFITGVSLEIGDVATPFQHESFAETLQKCQRYYTTSGFNGGTPYGGGGIAMYAFSVSEAGGTVTFPTTMRAGPTIRTKDADGNIGGIHRAAAANVTSGVSVQWAGNAESNKIGFSGLTKSNAWAVGNMLIGVWDATAEL